MELLRRLCLASQLRSRRALVCPPCYLRLPGQRKLKSSPARGALPARLAQPPQAGQFARTIFLFPPVGSVWGSVPWSVCGFGTWTPSPLHLAHRVLWSLELRKLWLGCQDVRTTLWKARANSETDRVSDKLFTGFLEGASAIFQSVKVAFLPPEQCLIVVCVCVCVCVRVCLFPCAHRESLERGEKA